MRRLPALILLLSLSACVSPGEPSQAVPPASTPAAGPQGSVAPLGTKRIIRMEAGRLQLPDGTIVAVDARGGFTLPNGAYILPDATGDLPLPNGTRCVPDGVGGYLCP